MLRREFLLKGLCLAPAIGAIGLMTAACDSNIPKNTGDLYFLTRGVVLTLPEIEAMPWPAICRKNGINLIDQQISPTWLLSPPGKAFLADCHQHNVGLEWSSHCMSWALPRDLFGRNPQFFRMDANGQRTPEGNLCVHSSGLPRTIDYLVDLIESVPTTTDRYYLWTDDGAPMCLCPKCKEYSDSEQALIFENELLVALRKKCPSAKVAHLAYQRTLSPPWRIKPQEGVFLQFAGFQRSYTLPFSQREARRGPGYPSHGELLDHLDENLSVFGAGDSQAFEYWLDNALHSGWDRQKIGRVPWRRDVFTDDLITYARRGIRHIRTYVVWMDRAYIERFGQPPMDEYGKDLNQWLWTEGKAVNAATGQVFVVESDNLPSQRNS